VPKTVCGHWTIFCRAPVLTFYTGKDVVCYLSSILCLAVTKGFLFVILFDMQCVFTPLKKAWAGVSHTTETHSKGKFSALTETQSLNIFRSWTR